MDDDKYNCTACDVSLSSWAELQQHLQGSSHKIQTEPTHEAEEVRVAIAEGFLVFQSSQKIKCLLCKIVIDFHDSLPIYNHIQELEHKRLASIGLPEEKKEEKQSGNDELEAQQKLEAMALDKTLDVSGGSYNCTACNVQAKSIQQLQQHMEGGKHKLRANESPEAEEVKAQLDKGYLRQKSGLKINCLLCKTQVDFLDDIGPIYQHIHDPEHLRLAELGLGAVPTEVEVLSKEELDAKLNADESPEAETVREAMKAGFLRREERGKFFCKPCKATLDFKEVRPLNEHLSGNKHQYAAYMWQMWKRSGRGFWRGRGRGFFPPPPPMWGRGGGHPYPGFYEDYHANPRFDRGMMYPPTFWGRGGWGRGRGRGRSRGRGRGRGGGSRGSGRGGRGGKNQNETTEDEGIKADEVLASPVGAGEQQSYGLENLEENIEAALEGDNQMPPKKRVRNIEVISGTGR
ncbi:unnamed protein product [Meganyctiphanes norvegica]|uniref:C2H2-type domain-containing protein n=1 Tax=Meganyctiphanes norvegica TaxID=48144 RepID=A0AAV2S7H3_MEGNR